MNLSAVLRSWSRAFVAQFSPKVLLLSLVPLVLSLMLWGGLMWWRMQSILDFVQNFYVNHESGSSAAQLLNSLGLLALKTVIVPLVTMWALLPVMIMTSLLFIGVIVMPAVGRIIGKKDFPQLERRQGGSFFSSLGFSLFTFFLFTVLWIVTLPLIFFPPIYVVVQPLLWGWLTYRIMAYDALALHADPEERKALFAQHRGSFLVMGLIAGWVGTLPGAFWLGGAMSVAYVAFFPFFVSIAIWLYLVIFIYTGCWFQYYCLDALQELRAKTSNAVATQ
ncbi:EI24 domain-containing protein [Undibacterium cyanobacteriorum]|uniref:EI24 domain-containing protein n=1 Tax=Undibacterium cyanobacteriorum TaxID=3073561 RepID=A0ABY9RKL7_9BURK|nr:EI24 domain-containing protein [Undibacterium sp. 20NA77.5]WMW81772.1 EI24 domain-containing protein [Undibacterium sp. 20NA77.5]